MATIDRKTGKLIGGEAELAQSIETILTTPQGSRIKRRDFGNSALQPAGGFTPGTTEEEAAVAAIAALKRSEPRAAFRSVTAIRNPSGVLDALAVRYVDLQDALGIEHELTVPIPA